VSFPSVRHRRIIEIVGRFEVGTYGVTTESAKVMSELVETWDAIRARRNVRTYNDRAIASEHLDRILEAGRRSPSASNRQPWDFVLVTEARQLQELSTVWIGAGHLATAKAAIVLVLPDPESERYRLMDQYDLGQATMAMMLAATDLGIGSGHSAVGDQEACQRILGSPPDHNCAYMLALGYPAERPLQPIAKPDRRPFDEVVHRGTW
jgi:nitroreductase